jgi:hypothetical protein
MANELNSVIECMYVFKTLWHLFIHNENKENDGILGMKNLAGTFLTTRNWHMYMGDQMIYSTVQFRIFTPKYVCTRSRFDCDALGGFVGL